MLLATTQVEDLDRFMDIFSTQGWQSFVSDPEVPPIKQQAGHKSRPQAARLVSHCDA